MRIDFYWMIELTPAFPHHPPFQATYYAGYTEHIITPYTDADGNKKFAYRKELAKTQDPMAAPKWLRKEDAEAVASKLLNTLSCVWSVTEHGFVK